MGAFVAPLAAVASVASCSSDAETVSPIGSGGAASATATSSSGSTASTQPTSSTSSSTSTTSTGGRDAGSDVNTDAPVVDAGDGPCALPGSVQFTASGIATVPGGQLDAPDLTFLRLPVGFCAHYFGTVGNTRQLRFAPGGELFVASPTTLTTGGGPGGLSAIVVLPDDDGDGYADSPIRFLNQLPSTQGLLFATDSFYYQDGTKIMKLPYTSGQRAPQGAATMVTDITYYNSQLHWPKPMDMADDGTLYVGNGGDQGEACDTSRPAHGAVVKVLPNGHGDPIAIGLRNPIAIRCTHGANAQCFGLELAKDYSNPEGGREKMFPIRDGDDWGFPCCATKGVPYAGVGQVDCSHTAPEAEGFFIGDTPFGLAFESHGWPAPWGTRAFVTLHGAAGPWTGTRLVSVEMDATTGQPVAGDDLADGSSLGGMVDFATGWDDGTLAHGRPAAVDFSPDGRLFVGNDGNGVIFWIAPI
ncbi:MAG TPA: hypothetical protein VGM56_05385 [Byssovorax sp.]